MLLIRSTRQFMTKQRPALVQTGKERVVGAWLGLTAAGVFSIILIGGYTRLSGSGLSMTGWLPKLPMTTEGWQDQFQKYKKYPEYKLKNKDISLEYFKKIYFVEWFHRIIGLSLGVGFTGPLLYFLTRGYLLPSIKRTLLGLLAVGSMQGAVGWWMVKSGLEEKPDYQICPKVSPYRLSMHLMTAAFLYSSLFWTSIKLLTKPLEISQQAYPAVRKVRIVALVTLKLMVVAIFSGCIVAGIDAGKTYNTWPDMNGSFMPAGALRRQPRWRNFFQNHGLVQFNHRYIAYSTVSLSWYLLYLSRTTTPLLRRSILMVVVMIHCQLGLGIANILNQSQLHTASAHQCVGFLSLTSLLYLLSRCKVIIK